MQRWMGQVSWRGVGLTVIMAAQMSVAQAGGLDLAGAGEPLEQPVVVAAGPDYAWSGFYAGASLGGGLFDSEASEPTDIITNDSPNLSEVVPRYGLHGGYNWQLAGTNTVIGAELAASFGYETSLEVQTGAGGGTETLNFENSWDSLIALKLRAGLSHGRGMVYVMGGPAFADAHYSVAASASDNSAEARETLTGVAIGAGLEHAFRDSWVGRFEVAHYAMPGTSAPLRDSTGQSACGGNAGSESCEAYFESRLTSLSLGISYRF